MSSLISATEKKETHLEPGLINTSVDNIEQPEQCLSEYSASGACHDSVFVRTVDRHEQNKLLLHFPVYQEPHSIQYMIGYQKKISSDLRAFLKSTAILNLKRSEWPHKKWRNADH